MLKKVILIFVDWDQIINTCIVHNHKIVKWKFKVTIKCCKSEKKYTTLPLHTTKLESIITLTKIYIYTILIILINLKFRLISIN